MHTIPDNVQIISVLRPEVRTAAKTSPSVDLGNGLRAVGVLIHVGAHDRTDSNETLTITVEHSDDNTNFTAISGASQVIGNVTPDENKGTSFLIALSETKRYVRVVGTPGGTTPSTAYSVALLAEPRIKPAAREQTVVYA